MKEATLTVSPEHVEPLKLGVAAGLMRKPAPRGFFVRPCPHGGGASDRTG